MILHHYSFTNLGTLLDGLTTLTEIAKIEGCTDVDAIEIDGGNFDKGRLTLCKKVCADNQPCFAIEFGESRETRRLGEAIVASVDDTLPLNFAPPPAPPKRGRKPRLVS